MVFVEVKIYFVYYVKVIGFWLLDFRMFIGKFDFKIDCLISLQFFDVEMNVDVVFLQMSVFVRFIMFLNVYYIFIQVSFGKFSYLVGEVE